jgi:hypothetical protein
MVIPIVDQETVSLQCLPVTLTSHSLQKGVRVSANE